MLFNRDCETTTSLHTGRVLALMTSTDLGHQLTDRDLVGAPNACFASRTAGRVKFRGRLASGRHPIFDDHRDRQRLRLSGPRHRCLYTRYVKNWNYELTKDGGFCFAVIFSCHRHNWRLLHYWRRVLLTKLRLFTRGLEKTWTNLDRSGRDQDQTLPQGQRGLPFRR